MYLSPYPSKDVPIEVASDPGASDTHELHVHDVRPVSAELCQADSRTLLGVDDAGGDSASELSFHSPSSTVSNERLPSTKGRSHLSRTPHSMVENRSHDQMTSSDDDDDNSADDNDSVLITELKEELPRGTILAPEWQDVVLQKSGVRKTQSVDSSEEEEEEGTHEEDWDTDLEIEESLAHEHDPTGRTQYARICEEIGVIPVSYFSRHITDTEMCMRHHGLGPSGTRAIAKVLKTNITLEKLNLSGNWMEGEGSFYMAKMLNENDYLTDLILADNKFGQVGAFHMTKMLASNVCLRKIDLSGNEFGDREASMFADAIEQNKYLKELNLSRNVFGEEAGVTLGPAIGANDILEHLDLSWNQIRRSGAVAVSRGIKENIRLKSVDLSWNGFGPEGGAAIADAVMANEALQELDISGNRLDMHSAVLLAKALGKNEELKTLKMGNNPITTGGCIAIAKALNESDNSVLCALYLTDIPVEYEFKKLVEQIQKKRSFRVLHGTVLRSGNTSDDINKAQVNPNPKQNPLVVLREHIVINDTRIVDILRQYDPQETYSVTTDHFALALKELGVPFSESQLEEIAIKLRRNEHSEIYYGDIVSQIEAAGGQALAHPRASSQRSEQPTSRSASRLGVQKSVNH